MNNCIHRYIFLRFLFNLITKFIEVYERYVSSMLIVIVLVIVAGFTAHKRAFVIT